MTSNQASRLHGVGIGSVIFAGQSTNRDQIPYNGTSMWIRRSCDTTIVRETKAFWITANDRWYRKSDGLQVPVTPMRLYLVQVLTT